MQLRDEHPAVDIRVFEEDTAVERLLAGELDLAYWVGPLDGPIESVKLLDDPVRAASPAAATSRTGPVRLEQLDGVQMVSFPRLLCDMGRVEDAFAAAGSSRWSCSAPPTTAPSLSMVRAGMGAAVMPMLAVDISPDDDVLCTHELLPAIRPREVCVMWQAGRTLSPLARASSTSRSSVAARCRRQPAEATRRRRSASPDRAEPPATSA